MQRKDEFDLLVKVDADMVLCSPDLFERIVAMFRADANLELLSIAVHDHMTDRLIGGLNSYRNTLVWTPTGELAFTDRVGTQRERRCVDRTELAPAAIHCPDPSPFQAFHFGLHRGVKCREAMRRRWHTQVEGRSEDVVCLWRHFLRGRDRRIGLGALAAEMALADEFGVEHISYDDPHARRRFAEVEQLDGEGLERLIRRYRRHTWGFLPWRLRMEAIRGAWLRFAARCVVPNPVIERFPLQAKV